MCMKNVRLIISVFAMLAIAGVVNVAVTRVVQLPISAAIV